MVITIWILLIILALGYCYFLATDFLKHKNSLETSSWVKSGAIGFIVNFFDVLGIGSFAPQTALLKFTNQTEDRLIPGTLNVANTLPTMLQAVIFIKIVKVDAITLVLMLVAATVGAAIGAGIVSKLSEKKIRLAMGFALLTTAGFMIANVMHWIEGAGYAIGLTGSKLLIAVAVNFILGALMTVGIGLYAPCMSLVFALGMSPIVAFPIMMGSCAFLMPIASVKFIRERAYNRKAAIAMAIPGMVAVLLAAFIVQSLPLDTLRWVVITIIIYTSANMLHSGLRKNYKERD